MELVVGLLVWYLYGVAPAVLVMIALIVALSLRVTIT